MEYSLRRSFTGFSGCSCTVLILILMEYSLRLANKIVSPDSSNVLILILMEYSLRHEKFNH